MYAESLEHPAIPKSYAGAFCDGTTARLVEVEVCIDEAGLLMQVEGVGAIRWAFSQIKASWQLPGSRIVTLRRDGAPERLYLAAGDIAAWKHKLSRSWPAADIRAWCAIALSLAGLFGGSLSYAPAWSRFISEKGDKVLEASRAAHAVTSFAQRTMVDGQEKPQYCVAADGMNAMEKLAAALAPETAPRDYALFVIHSDRVNAYSFGAGYIVLLSGLIDFANNQNELASVLAHEIGHDVEGHGTASALEAGLSDAIISLLFNSMIPALVGEWVEPGYIMSWRSRAAERDADRLAIDYMRRAGLNPAEAADFERRVVERFGDDNPYLSTHPTYASRIRELEAAEAPGGNVLTPAEWASIKRICREKTEEAAASLRRPLN